MKKPALLFALKFAIILYFAACTNTEDYVVSKSITTVVKTGDWKVNLFMQGGTDQTNDFSGYNFTFVEGGILKASKTGHSEITGSWFEDQLNHVLSIDLGTTDPLLSKLNQSWSITEVKDNQVGLSGNAANGSAALNITNQ